MKMGPYFPRSADFFVLLELKNDLAGVVSWEDPYLWNQTFFSQYVRPMRTYVRYTHTLEPDPAHTTTKKD